jgi:nucleotide-binding universal stress UspA family protein
VAEPAGPSGGELGVVPPELRILVGVDGSPSGQRALDWAIDETQRGARTLRLLTAWLYPMALGYSFSTSVDEVRQAALDVLDQAMAHVVEVAPDVGVMSEAMEQAPAAALVKAARDADLLVVGSRGRGGFEGLLVGSVSLYCVRHAPCPVVVVH